MYMYNTERSHKFKTTFLFLPHMQEGSCIMTGISYNGMDKSGRPDWSGLTNIKLYDFETCITLQVYV